jgi:hypothetical protein
MNIPVATFEERLHQDKDNIFSAFAQVESLVKQRGAPDEITAAALVWIARLRWAVEDAYEFKTRQMAMNPAEEARLMLGPFLTLLQALTTEIKQAIITLESHETIPQSVMEDITIMGNHLQPQFYHC